MLQSHNSVSSFAFESQSRYRVMLLRADGEIALVYLAKTLGNAVRIAREASQNHLARLEIDWQQIIKCVDRPRMIYVEAWQGTPTDGAWKSVRRNGFQFEFHDRRRGRRKQMQEPTKKSWETGSLVRCILLPRRTRKGGWRAEIAGTQHQGPVTNWQAIPANFTAGAEVELKLCSVSHQTGAAQFSWPT